MSHWCVWKDCCITLENIPRYMVMFSPSDWKCRTVKRMLHLCRYLYELCLITIRRPTTWYHAEKLAWRSRRATFCTFWRRTTITGGRRGTGLRTTCLAHCSLQASFLLPNCWSGRPAALPSRELNENTLPRLEVSTGLWPPRVKRGATRYSARNIR